MPPAERAPLTGDSALLRAVGAFALALGVVNVIVGGGIFLMPAELAKALGPAAPLAPLLGALVIVPIALCFAGAGSRVDATGGPYSYASAAFGPLPGFIAGALMWISNIASSAGVAAGLAGALASLWPVLGESSWRAVLLVGVYGALTVLNLAGVKAGSRAIVLLTTLKLAPLVLLCVLGIWAVDWSQVSFVPSAEASLGASMIVVMFAYSGMETALVPSAEVKSSARSVPLATLVAVGFVVLLYFTLQLVSTGVLGVATLAGSSAPLAATAGALWGPGFVLLLLTASVSMLGFLQGNLLGTSRLVYALARDGFLPRPLAGISAGTRVPVAAVLLHAGLALALALVGSFGKLVLISGGAICLTYLLCCASAWQLQRRGMVSASGGAPFRLPGGAWPLPVLACALLAWVLTTLKADEWAAIGVALAAIVLLYAAIRALRRG